MNLLFNIANLRFGGGVSVARNLLENTIPLRPADNIYIIAPKDNGYEQLGSYSNTSILFVPGRFHTSWPVKYYYNYVVFRRLAVRYHIDKIISLGNIAFPAGDIPQMLLLQNAWPVYPDSIAWQALDRQAGMYNRFMNAWTERNLHHASFYALQTPVMQERFCKQFHIPGERTCILPNAVAFKNKQTPLPQTGSALRLLMLGQYYPHKNFSVLLPLAKLVKEQQKNITVTITIDPAESAPGKAFLQQVKALGLDEVIINAGRIPQQELPALYARHDALLFPTLLESFSATYAEAMYYGLPVFTSDLDFAHGICADAAFYFNPLDAAAILQTITKAFDHPDIIKHKTAQASAIAQSMPGWGQIAQQFSEIIDRFE